jgi:hypothetical protein
MKRNIWTALLIAAILLPSSIAQATTLSLKWAADETSQSLVVPPGTSATINVYIDMPNDGTVGAGNVASVFFDFAWSSEELSMLTSSIVPLAGWSVGGQDGTLGGSAQFAVADPTATGITSGLNLVGSFDVTNDNVAVDGMQESIVSNAFANSGVRDNNGSALTWDLRYYASYDSYIAFGDWGSPYWEAMQPGNFQPDNPLYLINDVPEPASAGLLALVAAALIRRR